MKKTNKVYCIDCAHRIDMIKDYTDHTFDQCSRHPVSTFMSPDYYYKECAFVNKNNNCKDYKKRGDCCHCLNYEGNGCGYESCGECEYIGSHYYCADCDETFDLNSPRWYTRIQPDLCPHINVYDAVSIRKKEFLDSQNKKNDKK